MKALERYSDAALALLRVVAALLFMTHGLQKIFGVLEGQQPPMWSQLWIGGVIEMVCGGLMALGLFTRPAAFLASGTMAVAYVQFHWKLAVDQSFFPIMNHGEPAVIYAVLFFYFVFVGGGRYSLDQLRR
jgi:putative oxidoreductase